MKFNFSESKPISNPARGIQVSHLITEEAELGRFGGGVQGRGDVTNGFVERRNELR